MTKFVKKWKKDIKQRFLFIDGLKTGIFIVYSPKALRRLENSP